MKKVVRYLCLIIMIFTMLPLNIMADCGMSFINVKMKISNKDGAKLYEAKYIDNKNVYTLTGDTVKYGEEVTILHEYKDYAVIEYQNNHLYIKTSDYSYSSEKENKNNNFIKYYAYADTIIRNVPSFYSYEVVETIPANTYFEISGGKNLETDYEYVSGEAEWAFASYNGKTGWVHVGDCVLQGQPITIFNKYEKSLTVYALGVDNLYNGFSEGFSILGDDSTKKELNIKRGEKVEIIGDYHIGHDTYYYIKTNNTSEVWVTGTFYKEAKEKAIAILNVDDLTIRDFNSLKNVNIKLSNYKIYDSPYEIVSSYDNIFEDYIIRIDNKDYLLSEKENKSCSILNNKKINLTLNDELSYYDYSFSMVDYNKLGMLPKGNYQGYQVSNSDNIYFIPDYGFIKYVNPNSNQENENNNQDYIIIEGDSISETTYIIYCIIGTIVVAVIAGIIIILVNKKNKKKINL